MRRRLLALVAALSSLPLTLAAAPSAQAADPTTMTNGFYVDPDSSARRWAAANPGDGRAPAINASIANTPTARWFGSWSGTIGTATGAYAGAADARDRLPVLVAYNIYHRDYCAGTPQAEPPRRPPTQTGSPSSRAGSGTVRPSSSSNRTPSGTTAA